MQVSVEKVSKIERRLTITVPADQVEEAFTKQINQFAKKANIKGFRPGKAPISYIQQRYGQEARTEAMGDVIKTALYQALEEQKLVPISTPQIEPKVMTPSQPLEFVASFEVLPEIGKVIFKAESIEKLVVEVTDEDINRVIDRLRKQHTNWSVVERELKENDRVVIDYVVTVEGQEAKKFENMSLDLGNQHMPADFEQGLLGVRAGDERTISVNFPADITNTELAGKPAQFVVQVKKVFEAQPPVIDEAFFKSLGIASGKEEDLRQQVRQSLELERDRLVKDKLKEQIYTKLVEQNPVEVPKSLIASEAKKIHDNLHPDHKHGHHHSDEELNQFNEIAQKRVALSLLVSEFAKLSSLKADSERVQKRILEIASVYENPKEVIDWLSAGERRADIEAQVLEDEVIDKLMEGIDVKEKTMSYAELKGIRI